MKEAMLQGDLFGIKSLMLLIVIFHRDHVVGLDGSLRKEDERVNGNNRNEDISVFPDEQQRNHKVDQDTKDYVSHGQEDDIVTARQANAELDDMFRVKDDHRGSSRHTINMFRDPDGEYYSTFKDKRKDIQHCNAKSYAKELDMLRKKHSLVREDLIQCRVQQKHVDACKLSVMGQIINSLALPLDALHNSKDSNIKIEVLINREEMVLFEIVKKALLPSRKDISEAFIILKDILRRGNASKCIPENTAGYYSGCMTNGVALVASTSLVLILLFQLQKRLTLRRFLVMIFLVAFILSIPWEWYRLYKHALARKIAEAEALSSNECNPEKLSTFKSLKLWFQLTFTFKEDDCVKYHQSVLVDPFWEVSPLKAISASLTNFFFAPLTIITEAMAKSFNIMMRELPLQWQVPVFIALLLLLLFIVFSVCGFQINLPLVGFKVGDRGAIAQGPADRVAADERQIRLLQNEVKALQEELNRALVHEGGERRLMEELQHQDRPFIGVAPHNGNNASLNGSGVEDILLPVSQPVADRTAAGHDHGGKYDGDRQSVNAPVAPVLQTPPQYLHQMGRLDAESPVFANSDVDINSTESTSDETSVCRERGSTFASESSEGMNSNISDTEQNPEKTPKEHEMRSFDFRLADSSSSRNGDDDRASSNDRTSQSETQDNGFIIVASTGNRFGCHQESESVGASFDSVLDKGDKFMS